MRSRFIIAFTFIILGLGYWAYDEIASSMERRYREVVEELLVDQVQLVASGLSHNWLISDFNEAMDQSRKRNFEAKIYDLIKTKSKLKAYVTDRDGRVLYHSESDSLVNADFSQWRDVFLTLKGKYGARSTRTISHDERSSVLWVSAPIYRKGKINGVVSLGKSVADWSTLLNSAVWSIQKGTLGFVALGIALSLLLSLWVFNPLRKLKLFVAQENLAHPNVGDEITQVASALTNLKEDLQAKQYVENYVQILTHELKSPISAILGSTEILESSPEKEVVDKFTANISSEARRMQILVETILKVSQLELENEIEKKPIKIEQLVEVTKEALQHPLFDSEVELIVSYLSDFLEEREKSGENSSEMLSEKEIQVDQVLFVQALVNLLLNAIQYSPPKESVQLEISEIGNGEIEFTIRDRGPGIPDFAIDRIYDKFYSLKKPRTGKKGTGLGLPFVKEVARLHQGNLSVENGGEAGVVARLVIRSV